jgi:hypothetical protein
MNCVLSSNAGVMGSNSIRGADVCVYIYCVFVWSWLHIVVGWAHSPPPPPPVQGDL